MYSKLQLTRIDGGSSTVFKRGLGGVSSGKNERGLKRYGNLDPWSLSLGLLQGVSHVMHARPTEAYCLVLFYFRHFVLRLELHKFHQAWKRDTPTYISIVLGFLPHTWTDIRGWEL